VNATARLLNPSEAARQLGISAKALRLYEERGLIAPPRSSAGWRAYGPDEMARAGEIVALRALGLSLGEVARVLGGDAALLEHILAAHETALQNRARLLGATVEKVRRLRAGLARGERPRAADIARAVHPAGGMSVAFDLPWPWGGEPFALHGVKPLTHIVGPLGSGKTRFAKRLAEALPDAVFLGLDRLDDDGATTRARLAVDASLASRAEHALTAIVAAGGTRSVALTVLAAALEAPGTGPLVIDMLEQNLDAATQEALISHLRRRGPDARPLLFLTRSSAILDLDCVGPDETIILCPANHSPPVLVVPYRGAPGYEALASCLASPAVRARTEGVIAWRPSHSWVDSAAMTGLNNPSASG
jgi:DNA-binding transcriptional MerR regulator